MNATQNCSHWICCPACGGKTRIKVYEDIGTVPTVIGFAFEKSWLCPIKSGGFEK